MRVERATGDRKCSPRGATGGTTVFLASWQRPTRAESTRRQRAGLGRHPAMAVGFSCTAVPGRFHAYLPTHPITALGRPGPLLSQPLVVASAAWSPAASLAKLVKASRSGATSARTIAASGSVSRVGRRSAVLPQDLSTSGRANVSIALNQADAAEPMGDEQRRKTSQAARLLRDDVEPERLAETSALMPTACRT